MKQSLVTIKQAEEIRALGFHEETSNYIFRADGDRCLIYGSSYDKTDWNDKPDWFMSIPTVDETIDWLRRKFNVIIYNSAEPVVQNKTIKYGYAVKHCNKQWGWNQRVYISRGEWSTNHYAAKRMAIAAAIRWIKQQKSNGKKSKH